MEAHLQQKKKYVIIKKIQRVGAHNETGNCFQRAGRRGKCRAGVGQKVE
ncbi:hypothetical protein [Treponema sp. UBA6852]|nr:hypothetical protein [Treponema sp. UBA6852]